MSTNNKRTIERTRKRGYPTALLFLISLFVVSKAGAQCTAPTVNVSNPTSCSTPNGSITITAPTPLSNYTFSIDDGATFQSSNVFSNLAASNYKVRTKEKSTFCISNFTTATLAAPAVTSPTATTTGNSNCSGTPNGSLTITGPTPLASYTFSIDNGVTFQSSATFNNLAAGTYQVVAKNTSIGCISSALSSTVSNSSTAPSTPTSTTTNPTSCSSPNGSISVTGPTPLANYQFSIDNGATFQNSATFSNLAAGTYNVKAKTIATGCISAAGSVTLTASAVTTPTATTADNTVCSGTPNGSITLTGPAPLANYTFSVDNGSTFSGSTTFSNLAAGTYNVVAKSIATGCKSSALTSTINNVLTTPATPTATSSDPTSCSSPNGSIAVTTPTPLANYRFSIDGGETFQSSASFSNLAAGTYSVRAQSIATNCVSATTSITLWSPIVSTPTVSTSSNTNCNSTGNGSITITGPTPLSSYTFSINNGKTFQSSATFSNLSAGTYLVVAKNTATGCTSSALSSSITSVTSTPATPTSTNSNPTSCSSPNGSISLTGPTPLANYQFSIDNGATFQSSSTFNNLAAGTYIVVDKNVTSGCISFGISVTLTAPSAPATPTENVIDNTSCSSTSNGSVTFTGPTPLANCMFSIDGGLTFQSNATINNVLPGVYYAVCKDISTGCTSTARVVLYLSQATSAAPTPTASLTNPSSCSSPNGSINITGPTPLSNYKFSIDGGTTFQSGTTFNNLAPGTYKIIAQNNATSCFSSAYTPTLSATSTITSPTATSTSTRCSGTPNGSITITGPTPLTNYKFSIDNGVTFQSGSTFSNLTPGTYNVMAQSTATGCTSSAISIQVSMSAAPSAPGISSVNPTSCSSPDGSIAINSPTPLTKYQFSINGGGSFQNSAFFSSLTGSSYNVVVKDTSTGCISAATVATLTNPSVTTPTATTSSNSLCNGTGNGSISFTSPTPSSNYTYSIDSGAHFQSSATFTNLVDGTYKLYAKNISAGCVSTVLKTAVALTPAIITPTIFSSNPTNCNNPNGSITITDPTPTSSYSYSITGGLPFQSSNLFGNLFSGTYKVVVKSNATGCSSSVSTVTLAIPTPTPAPTIGTYAYNSNCTGVPNGSCVLAGPTPLANYAFSSDSGVTFQSSNTLSNLAAGHYNIVAKDLSTGCISASTSLTIINFASTPAKPTYSTVAPTSCAGSPNGSITFTSVGVPYTDYKYSIDSGRSWQTSATATINNLGVGNYNLRVLYIPTGCVSPIQPVTIAPATITLPTATGTNATKCNPPDGKITFAIAAPSALSNFGFSIDGGKTYNIVSQITGLLGGNYTILAKNLTSGCIYTLPSVTINEPQVTLSYAKTANTKCTAPSNGAILFSSPLGSIYRYSVNGGTNFYVGDTFNKLNAGVYNLAVKDTITGCITMQNNVIVSNATLIPNSPTVSAYFTVNDCNNPTGGFTISGPLPLSNYAFSVDNGITYQTSPTFRNLNVGVYHIEVKDVTTGCTNLADIGFTVTASSTPSKATATAASPTNCSPPNGTLTINSTQSPTYLYSIDGGTTFQTGTTFSGLADGTYTILTKDALTGCLSTGNNSYILTAPPAITLTYYASNSSSCSPGGGSIVVTAPTPLTDYVYSKDGGVSYQNNYAFTSLTPSKYTVIAKNRVTGCTSTPVLVTIAGPTNPDPPTITTQNPSSCAKKDGSITFTAPLPLSNDSFSIDGINYQTNNIFSNLGTGQYPLIVKNRTTGCMSSYYTQLGCNLTPSITKTAYKDGYTTPATSISTHDTINYVIEVASGTSTPTLTEVLGSNQTYVSNSAMASGWTLNGGTAAWFGSLGYGNATATLSSAAMNTGYGTSSYSLSGNIYNSSVSNVIFAGSSGDGFWPIYWKTNNCQEKAMVKNHHNNKIACWNLTTNTSCNNDISVLVYQPDFSYTYSSAASVTIKNKVYTVDKSIAGTAQINCIDLNPAGNPYWCAGYPISLSQFPQFTNSLATPLYENFANIGRCYDSAKNCVYFAMDSLPYKVIFKFDLSTGKVTESQPVYENIRFAYAEVTLLTSNRVLLDANGSVICVDISAWPKTKDCDTSSAPGVYTIFNSTTVNGVMFSRADNFSPLLDPAGHVNGFCVPGSCYNLYGKSVPIPPNYNINAGEGNYLITGTKVITMHGAASSPQGIFCYDFATNTPCGSNSEATSDYGLEWRVKGKCFISYGDGGILRQFGIEPTGLVQNSSLCLLNACTGNINLGPFPNPASLYCSGDTSKITYDFIEISNLPTVHSTGTLKILCGNSVMASYPIQANALVANIPLNISHSSCPNLYATLDIPNNNIKDSQKITATIHYSNAGHNPQICFKSVLKDCSVKKPLTNEVFLSGSGITTALSDTTTISADSIICPFTVSGKLLNDTNGLKDNTMNGTGTNFGGMNVVLIDNVTGKVVAVVPVASDGTYSFSNVFPGNYSLEITTKTATVGSTPPPVTLPAGYANAGENKGVTGPGDGLPNGILNIGYTTGTSTNNDFGLDQIPVADNKSYATSLTDWSNNPPSGFPQVNSYMSIPMSSGALTGYTSGGSLTGSDNEDCPASSTCNTGSSFVLDSINPTTLVYYDFGGTTGVKAITPGQVITNFNPNKLVVYGANGSGVAGVSPVGFTYSLVDAAGVKSPPATYEITSNTPLPVELVNFTVHFSKCDIVLNWLTAMEDNLDGFDIQYSRDGKLFNTIGSEKAKGAGYLYSFTHKFPNGGYYRLMMASRNGTFQYSRTIAVAAPCGQAATIAIRPNPANAEITLTGVMAGEQLHIRNMQGQAVLTVTLEGDNAKVNISQLPAGIYAVTIESEGTILLQTKLLKSDKQ